MTSRERQLTPLRRARERGQRRRALERARRVVLRARQVRVDLGKVLCALRPIERVRALKVKAGLRGLEARLHGVLVWWGGGGSDERSRSADRDQFL